MSDHFAANFPLLVSCNEARNKVSSALRLFVGRGRRYSVKQLANGTGVPDWAINQALIPADDPKHRALKHEYLMSISVFLGAPFITEWLSPAGVGTFDLLYGDVCARTMAADNTDDNATLVRAAIDGIFDDDEHPDLIRAGNRMMQRGASLISLGRIRPSGEA